MVNSAASKFINASLKGNAALAAATPEQDVINDNLKARKAFTEGSIKGGATKESDKAGLVDKAKALYNDIESLGSKKSQRPQIQQASTPSHQTRKQQVQDELGSQRKQMMQSWLNERRDTSFNKYRGPRSTHLGRPRGVLSQ